MNNIQIVQLLLESGADFNAPGDGDHGRTALRAAAENDNVQMVQLLLDSGAGRTALQAAAEKSHVIVPLLVILQNASHLGSGLLNVGRRKTRS
jgi:ankyrin repeat protein